jgi:transposase InsO family protein
MISKMQGAAKKQAKFRNDTEDYQLKTYFILTIAGESRIIKKKNKNEMRPKTYVFFEEIYDILCKEHIAIGHGKRDRLYEQCKLWHENVTYEAVNAFLSCCIECVKRTPHNTISNMVIKPVRSSNALSRTQIDLIDIQTFPDGDYKWILTVQDHFTKFVNLRALKQKRAVEVANALYEIFLTFGAPCILQSDNGKEFRASVVENLKSFWPELKIVHGRPRHPESQGSVERANGEVKRLLSIWIRTTGRKDWTTGIKVVQFQYNRAYNKNLESSPFKVLFGIDPPVGLQSTIIPNSIYPELYTETDLNNALNDEKAESDESEDEIEIDEFGDELNGVIKEIEKENEPIIEQPIKSKRGRKKAIVNVEAPPEPINATTQPLPEPTLHERRITRTTAIREKANERQETLAKKMTDKTNKYLVPVKIGDNVVFFTDEVDRGITDPPNLLCKIHALKHDNFELASEAGIIDRLVPRNAFAIAPKHIEFKVITDKTTSIRGAINALSIGGGQGFFKCGASCKCNTMRCSCKKAGILCNSKCHKSTTCTNKLVE